MGVLNCTPDSFSDGGKFVSQAAGPVVDVDGAVRHARAMHQQGSAIIDVGGESTRPGSVPVLLEEELRRVIPVIQALAAEGLTLSIDTTKAEVMRQAIAAGASMVNDVTALRGDPESLSVVAESGVDVCLMHMQGTPATMQKKPAYRDVLDEVVRFFETRIEACLGAGISEASLLIDPGIGFGKRLEDNLALIANIEVLKRRFGLPVLMGISRKSFLGQITGSDVASREPESTAAIAIAVFSGSDLLRVHDVEAQRRAVDVASRLRDAYLGLS
ncbi:MAG: dihydropteroate synthase [Mariprofundaceae bacterium]|nr:dihydropteroate synthase [Mariprofundaceae bacterium]